MSVGRTGEAPLAGIEPAHTAPEADALSAELQGLVVFDLPVSRWPPERH